MFSDMWNLQMLKEGSGSAIATGILKRQYDKAQYENIGNIYCFVFKRIQMYSPFKHILFSEHTLRNMQKS